MASFESFVLLADQGHGEAGNEELTWHPSNLSMPDAPVDV